MQRGFSLAFKAVMKLVLVATIGFAGQVVAQESHPSTNPKMVDAKDGRYSDPFKLLHDKPLSDSPTLIPQLIAKAGVLPPPYLYELARRLWATDKATAMEWFAVGKARAFYDAMRCVDTTARQGIMYLPMIAPDVVAGIEADRGEYRKAGLRALARPDVFVDAISPAWICAHGIQAINSAIQGNQNFEPNWLRPSSEWGGIRQEVRNDLTNYFIEQAQPQDDPIPMTKVTYPQLTLLAPVGPLDSHYGWLDNQHLIASVTFRDSNGKSHKRLVRFSEDGKREEVTETSGMWCAGNGVITYQTASEKLSDNIQQHITFAVGAPGKWSSFTLDLRPPLPATFGAQEFAQWVSLPTNATRQSPFDCRWETSASLSGPKNANQWIPLLPGHGAIKFDTGTAYWINSNGQEIRLPIDSSQVSLDSFRYVGWKQAYFVAPTWSRLKNRDKTLPTCVPAVYIYPGTNRVEEVCVPFDNNSKSNAVMFAPSRIGWLRATAHRNTAQGMKTGGLYLVRPTGMTEKLVESNIRSWDLSPDGCRVAFAHNSSGSSPTVLDILDLCRESKTVGS